jgi:hypothetical protein
VSQCKEDFWLFNRDILVKDLSDDKVSLDAISKKLSLLEDQIRNVINN